MSVLVAFIVTVAAPGIRADLHSSSGGLQLVVSGYTITYAVLLITGARLGGRFGHRRLFLGGLLGFTAASLASGLAQSTGQLIAFRLVQGAAAAVMVPQVLSLIQQNYSGPGRSRALNVYAAVTASGAAVGQVLGGGLVTADLFGSGWRPVFLVNVVIGAVLLAAGWKVLPKDRGSSASSSPASSGAPRPLDLPGLLLLAASVGLFTVPLVLGQERGWPLWCWISLGVSVLLFAGFLRFEGRLAGRGGAPLISRTVLQVPGMAGAMTAIGAVMMANAGLTFALALHLQSTVGLSALHTGLIFLPSGAAFGVAGMCWQRVPQRWQGLLVPAGYAVAVPGFVLAGLLLSDGGDGGVWLLVDLAVTGLALGAAYGPLLTVVLGRVRREDAADASGLLATVTQLGILLGIAACGTLFFNLTERYPDDPSQAVLLTLLATAAIILIGLLASLGLRKHAH
jgi:MFS family permease